MGGVAVLGIGWVISADVSSGGATVSVRFGAGDLPKEWVNFAYCTAFALIIIGAGMLLHQFTAEARLLQRKAVLAVELRGLVNTVDTPLRDAVPGELTGTRKEVLVDVREHVRAGTPIELQTALDKINLIPARLSSETAGSDRSDRALVVGGLLPVPFLFLVGMLIDDEGDVTLMDWKRHEKAWSELDGADDGESFALSGVEGRLQSEEVVVVVSASYPVALEHVSASFPGLPLVRLQVQSAVPDRLWSEIKQSRLASQFLEVVATLIGHGAHRLHLVLAVPASLALRLGQSYDRRNLPDVIVYQYERTSAAPYPWGVRMPTHGIASASLVIRNR